MPILSPSDRYTYLPTSTLTDEALTALVLQAQVMIEGPLGANRPLEVTSYTEALYMAGNAARLGYVPVLASPAPVVQIRSGPGGAGFGRNDSTDPWYTLDSDVYEIDTTLGEIRLQQGAAGWGGTGGYGYYAPYAGDYSYAGGVSNPVEALPDSQLRITYSAGFDFTADTAEVRQLKAAAAALVAYLGSNTFKGIEEVQTQREGRIRYVRTQGYNGAFGVGPGQVPEAMMMPFQRYRPRVTGIF